jgi:pseudaminic acid synthase
LEILSEEITIDGQSIGSNRRPLLVAEMSGNHNQSLERALQIVEAAAQSGAHALKLQTYTPDQMTLNSDSKDFLIADPSSLWSGKTLYNLYQEASTPLEWHKPIFKRCEELGLMCFSTPFHAETVDFLLDLGCPCFKIASFELTYFPLLKRVAATGKPVIMSTGMASLSEIEDSVKFLKEHGSGQIILLKCTSTYPATAEHSNVRTIPDMRDKFKCPVGLSDHTMGTATSVASVALGAVLIEKHFTLSRAEGGVDSAFSMEPAEFKQLVQDVNHAYMSLGEVIYGPQNEKELNSMNYRRSIYVSQNIQPGEVLTENNLSCVRPAFGLSTKYFDQIIGKKAKRPLTVGAPLKKEDFE